MSINSDTSPVLDCILKRYSVSRLVEPAPSAIERQQILEAAVCAPDHARLKPWRFFWFSGEKRQDLGECFLQAKLKIQPDLPVEAQEKIKALPLRAPAVLVVAAQVCKNHKVPEIEQVLATGAAVQNALLAIDALGYHAIWRTGEFAYFDEVKQFIGLESKDHLVGFIYIGTAESDVVPYSRPLDLAWIKE
jgi:nitroreductase